ncbi:MAG: hypothetical protein ACI4O7_07880 [Aristaeellaceae bacterium]
MRMVWFLLAGNFPFAYSRMQSHCSRGLPEAQDGRRKKTPESAADREKRPALAASSGEKIGDFI